MKESIAKILGEHNRSLKVFNAMLAGIDSKELQRLSEAGLLEYISRGLYTSGSVMADEYLGTQYRCGKGIVKAQIVRTESRSFD